MAEMYYMSDESRSIRVSIFGRDYNVRGGSDEEYVRELAEYVDSVMNDIAEKAGTISSGRIAILAALNIADEMNKERRHFEDRIDELAQRLADAMNVDQQADTDQQPDDSE
jgi:cell division protein ZapA